MRRINSQAEAGSVANMGSENNAKPQYESERENAIVGVNRANNTTVNNDTQNEGGSGPNSDEENQERKSRLHRNINRKVFESE